MLEVKMLAELIIVVFCALFLYNLAKVLIKIAFGMWEPLWDYRAYKDMVRSFATAGIYKMDDLFTEDHTRIALTCAKIPFLNKYVYEKTYEKIKKRHYEA